MENWRPEGWDKIRKEYGATDVPDNEGIYDDEFTAGFEAGADAIVKAIWELAKESPTGTFSFDSNEVNIFNNEVKK